MDEVKYISQGAGRGIVYKCLAEIHYANSKKRKPTKDEMHDFMQEMADESMESFVPNPLLGSNPEPMVSPEVSKLYQSTEQGLYNFVDMHDRRKAATDPLYKALTPEKKQTLARKHKIELTRAVSHLTTVIMEVFFDKERKEFGYKAHESGDTEKVKDQNRKIFAYRMIRLFVASFIWANIGVIARTGPDKFWEIFTRRSGLNKIPENKIASKKVYTAAIHGIMGILKNRNTSIRIANADIDLSSLFSKDWITKRIGLTKPEIPKQTKFRLDE